MSKTYIPTVGQTCPGMGNENYEYHLSGDCSEFCTCIINDLKCIGVVVEDDEDQSSRFFSRGQNKIDPDEIKKCHLYGCTKETFKFVLSDRKQKEIREKMDTINGTNTN